ncbi:MAG: low affinity iron permease family protein [Chloroflexota bacterium]|nr:low affinity iron permease family protein [Chloroflexota bacterium]
MGTWFARAASKIAEWTGSSLAFVLAALVIATWLISGPIFGFSDTWQLIINTGTTIVTFLMVFLIQNTQNRDTRAVHLKLDELLRAQHGAREREFIDLEDRDEAQLKAERGKLFEECGVCSSAEEHKEHGSPAWRRRHAHSRRPARRPPPSR